MTFSEYIRQNPHRLISGESGNYVLEVCHNRSWAYATEREAQIAAPGRCHEMTCSPQMHRIIEFDKAQPVRISRAWKRMVAADDN